MYVSLNHVAILLAKRLPGQARQHLHGRLTRSHSPLDPGTQVRDVQEAASRAKKAAQEAQRTAQRAAAAKPAALPGSDSRESLRAMLEADRRERAARGPVSVGSVAQPLPSAGGGGPARIRTAGEAGLNSG